MQRFLLSIFCGFLVLGCNAFFCSWFLVLYFGVFILSINSKLQPTNYFRQFIICVVIIYTLFWSQTVRITLRTLQRKQINLRHIDDFISHMSKWSLKVTSKHFEINCKSISENDVNWPSLHGSSCSCLVRGVSTIYVWNTEHINSPQKTAYVSNWTCGEFNLTKHFQFFSVQ